MNRLFIGGKSSCPRSDPADAPDSLPKSLSCPLAKVHLRLRCSEPEPYRKESGDRARRSQGTLQAFRNWELASGIPLRWETVPKPSRLRHSWTKPPPWRGIPWPHSAHVSNLPKARPPRHTPAWTRVDTVSCPRTRPVFHKTECNNVPRSFSPRSRFSSQAKDLSRVDEQPESSDPHSRPCGETPPFKSLCLFKLRAFCPLNGERAPDSRSFPSISRHAPGRHRSASRFSSKNR